VIATVNVLGIGVHALCMRSAVEAIADAVLHHQKGYVCVCGVHGVMEARRDPLLANVFANAFLVVPDGMPTVWMGRHQGYAIERVFGPDLMLAVLREPRLAAIRHYLYGGNPGVAQRLGEVLVRKSPGAQIVGTHCPPFRPLTLWEQHDLLSEIDHLQPDIIWVGLSTPKQERFMAEFLPKLRTTLLIGVGAAFDLHTGRINDSPDWLKQMGLQWLHRLVQEPSRLWRRYLVNNSQFLFEAFLQVFRLKEFRLHMPTLIGSVPNEFTSIHSEIR
jgi:N-acetylglucosaminyldiphosphoundecaprenol N-acetyl-beta-D-mannosaminyltransferase